MHLMHLTQVSSLGIKGHPKEMKLLNNQTQIYNDYFLRSLYKATEEEEERHK